LPKWVFLNNPAKAPAMKNLSPELQLVASLQGEVHALRVCINALLVSMPPAQRAAFAPSLEQLAEHTSANVLGSAVPEEVNQAFAHGIQSIRETAARN
jgi:hypothetical protein